MKQLFLEQLRIIFLLSQIELSHGLFKYRPGQRTMGLFLVRFYCYDTIQLSSMELLLLIPKFLLKLFKSFCLNRKFCSKNDKIIRCCQESYFVYNLCKKSSK